MALISGYMEAPYQGISQAAAAWRVPQQATLLSDAVVEIQKGFRKRPPMSYQTKFLSGVLTSNTSEMLFIQDPTTSALIHLLLLNQAGVITPYLFDATTNASIPVTVTPTAQTYLNVGSPKPHSDLRVLQIEDYNFILNRNVTVVDSGTTNPSRPFEALIFVAEGGYGETYNCTVTKSGGSPITGQVITPNGSGAGDSFWTSTNVIANAFIGGTYTSSDGGAATPMNAALVAAGFTIKYANSVLYLSHPSLDFTIVTDDGQGGIALKTIKTSTNLFSNLPSAAPVDGFTVKIAPTNAKGQDAYYVQYQSQGISQGVWQEVLAPGAALGLDPTKLPVALTKFTGAWVIDVVPWLQRTVGDSSLAPDPGFVGHPLKDMYFFGGRVALMYGEGSVFTGADNPFRLYPSTMVTAIDSDPFEVDNPDTRKALYEYAVPMYGGMVLAGQRSDCFLQNLNPGEFTLASTQTKVIARYQTDNANTQLPNADILAPLSANNRVYKAIPRDSQHHAFFEFAADRLSGQILPDDISAHIPTLIPNTVDRGCSIEPQYALLYGTSGATQLYLGLFRYANYQRVQTAWFQWFIHPGYTLAGMSAHGTTYYFLLRDSANNGHLATLQFSPDVLDDDASSTVLTHLDMRVNESHCTFGYNATLNQTTIGTAPTPVDATSFVAARAPSGATFPEGYLASVISRNYLQNTITVAGDWRTVPFYLGYSYVGSWVPTTIYRRSQDNRPITRARLSLTEMFLDVLDSIDLTTTISIGGRALRTYAKKVTSLGSPPVQFTGQWRVPINGKNVTTTLIISDTSHVGSKVAGFEWFGKHDPFFQRTT